MQRIVFKDFIAGITESLSPEEVKPNSLTYQHNYSVEIGKGLVRDVAGSVKLEGLSADTLRVTSHAIWDGCLWYVVSDTNHNADATGDLCSKIFRVRNNTTTCLDNLSINDSAYGAEGTAEQAIRKRYLRKGWRLQAAGDRLVVVCGEDYDATSDSVGDSLYAPLVIKLRKSVSKYTISSISYANATSVGAGIELKMVPYFASNGWGDALLANYSNYWEDVNTGTTTFSAVLQTGVPIRVIISAILASGEEVFLRDATLNTALEKELLDDRYGSLRALYVKIPSSATVPSTTRMIRYYRSYGNNILNPSLVAEWPFTSSSTELSNDELDGKFYVGAVSASTDVFSISHTMAGGIHMIDTSNPFVNAVSLAPPLVQGYFNPLSFVMSQRFDTVYTPKWTALTASANNPQGYQRGIASLGNYPFANVYPMVAYYRETSGATTYCATVPRLVGYQTYPGRRGLAWDSERMAWQHIGSCHAGLLAWNGKPAFLTNVANGSVLNSTLPVTGSITYDAGTGNTPDYLGKMTVTDSSGADLEIPIGDTLDKMSSSEYMNMNNGTISDAGSDYTAARVRVSVPVQSCTRLRMSFDNPCQYKVHGNNADPFTNLSCIDPEGWVIWPDGQAYPVKSYQTARYPSYLGVMIDKLLTPCATMNRFGFRTMLFKDNDGNITSACDFSGTSDDLPQYTINIQADEGYSLVFAQRERPLFYVKYDCETISRNFLVGAFFIYPRASDSDYTTSRTYRDYGSIIGGSPANFASTVTFRSQIRNVSEFPAAPGFHLLQLYCPFNTPVLNFYDSPCFGMISTNKYIRIGCAGSYNSGDFLRRPIPLVGNNFDRCGFIDIRDANGVSSFRTLTHEVPNGLDFNYCPTVAYIFGGTGTEIELTKSSYSDTDTAIYTSNNGSGPYDGRAFLLVNWEKYSTADTPIIAIAAYSSITPRNNYMAWSYHNLPFSKHNFENSTNNGYGGIYRYFEWRAWIGRPTGSTEDTWANTNSFTNVTNVSYPQVNTVSNFGSSYRTQCGILIASSEVAPSTVPHSIMSANTVKNSYTDSNVFNTVSYVDASSVPRANLCLSISSQFSTFPQLLGLIGNSIDIGTTVANCTNGYNVTTTSNRSVFKVISASFDGINAKLLLNSYVSAGLSLTTTVARPKITNRTIEFVDDLMDDLSNAITFDQLESLAGMSYGFYAEGDGVSYYGNIRSELGTSSGGTNMITWQSPPSLQPNLAPDVLYADAPIIAMKMADSVLWVFTRLSITGYVITGNSPQEVIKIRDASISNEDECFVYEDSLYYVTSGGIYRLNRNGPEELSYGCTNLFKAWKANNTSENTIVFGADEIEKRVFIGIDRLKVPSINSYVPSVYFCFDTKQNALYTRSLLTNYNNVTPEPEVYPNFNVTPQMTYKILGIGGDFAYPKICRLISDDYTLYCGWQWFGGQTNALRYGVSTNSTQWLHYTTATASYVIRTGVETSEETTVNLIRSISATKSDSAATKVRVLSIDETTGANKYVDLLTSTIGKSSIATVKPFSTISYAVTGGGILSLDIAYDMVGIPDAAGFPLITSVGIK